MYNKLLNYFENKCCISNIFMRKHWLAWYITISAIIIITIVYLNVTNLFLKYSITLGVNALILISLMITYFKLFCKEIKSELKIKNLYFGILELLQKYRRDSAYFEFQLSKMKKYCKKTT